MHERLHRAGPDAHQVGDLALREVLVEPEGERDPVSAWFESEFPPREFKGRSTELIETIVDKLES